MNESIESRHWTSSRYENSVEPYQTQNDTVAQDSRDVHVPVSYLPTLHSIQKPVPAIDCNMSKVAQIEERGATVAWSPLGDHADVMALGSKVSLLSHVSRE